MDRKDWHREDIKAAVRKSGVTLSALALKHGYGDSAARIALRQPWPAVERIIARQLGLQPPDIWPSRYGADGQPLRGRPNSADRNRSHRALHGKISEAA